MQWSRTMSSPADTLNRSFAPLTMCAIGLLLTVVQVNGFGFDFANDTIGFALVCVGAARLPGGPAKPWNLLVAASAGLAALASLFTYGGPAGVLWPMAYRLWNAAFYLESAAVAGVVIGLLLMLGSDAARGSSPPVARARVLLAGVYAVAATLQMVLFAARSAYFGPLGHLHQASLVVVGLVECLTVIAVFLAAARGRP